MFIENKISEMSQYGPITEDSVIEALTILLDEANYPGAQLSVCPIAPLLHFYG